jgi:tetratricopeptide (TPR) repeat protein
LSLEHSFAISHSLLDPLTTLAAAAILLVLVFAAMRCARRHPLLTFCVTWFLVTLFIESSFIGIELAFEHRLYLPMFAFALAIAYLISFIPERRLAMGSALAGIYLLSLVAASIFRNTIWQDPATLWADAAAKNPISYRARNNLGRVLMAQGKLAQAAQQFNDAISINPLYAEPHNNLGTLHARAGRFEIARAHFSAAIELNPGYAQAFNNLGVALLSQGRAYDASLQLAHAVRLAPGYAKAHANLSTALTHLRQLEAACRQLSLALKLDAKVPHSLETAEECRANTKVD